MQGYLWETVYKLINDVVKHSIYQLQINVYFSNLSKPQHETRGSESLHKKKHVCILSPELFTTYTPTYLDWNTSET